MNNFLIQDQQFKRLLDYLGLRGIVPHDYVSTIVPVISLGDLPQPTEIESSGPAPIAAGAPMFAPPRGEVWELIQFSGTLNQSGGTVAPVVMFQAIGLVDGGQLFFPWFRSANADGLCLSHAIALNANTRFNIYFQPRTLLQSGMSLTLFLLAGDGTIVTAAAATLVFRRFQDQLVNSA